MELKFVRYLKQNKDLYVLIAPLWNWNRQPKKVPGSWAGSSNRTFMELKFMKFTKATTR